jgi:hypothetical protein
MPMRQLACALSALCLACGASTESDGAPGGAGVGDPPQVVGSWHTCRERLELRTDLSWELRNLVEGCTSRGDYTLEGRFLSRTTESSDCTSAPANVSKVEVVRTATRLVLFHPDFGGGAASFVSDSEPRLRYRLTGQGAAPPANGQSVLRVVGRRQDGPVSACHWSADGQCGGLFACNGSVEQWQLDAGELTAKLGCTGSCPCAAVLTGSEGTEGNISGTFLGADCNATFTGTFDAEAITDAP